jgi:hypothetical protein
MHDHLGVARADEPVSAGPELAPQLFVVVDLAVQDEDRAPVLGVERLIAVRQVDDGEAPDREPRATVEVESRRVRAAVVQGRAHRVQQLRFDVPL